MQMARCGTIANARVPGQVQSTNLDLKLGHLVACLPSQTQLPRRRADQPAAEGAHHGTADETQRLARMLATSAGGSGGPLGKTPRQTLVEVRCNYTGTVPLSLAWYVHYDATHRERWSAHDSQVWSYLRD
jgi:hypothetical protein